MPGRGPEQLALLGVDNVEGATSLTDVELPRRCLFLFGQEGPGVSREARAVCDAMIAIDQYGSTRSINAGAASAVVMYEWCRRHAAR